MWYYQKSNFIAELESKIWDIIYLAYKVSI